MKATRTRNRRVLAFVSAIALLLQMSPAIAGGQSLDDNRPVEITFTKWGTSATAMEGFAEGYISGPFVGHLFRQINSANGHVTLLEAMYEVLDTERPFAALILGGFGLPNGGQLNGVILRGWRSGAPVHVEFIATRPANGGCIGAPPTVTLCFEGTIHIGRVPTRQN